MKEGLESSRRTFIKSATILGSLAALFGLSRHVPAKPSQAQPPTVQAEPHKGYRLTEHIRRYYETARF